MFIQNFNLLDSFLSFLLLPPPSLPPSLLACLSPSLPLFSSFLLVFSFVLGKIPSSAPHTHRCSIVDTLVLPYISHCPAPVFLCLCADFPSPPLSIDQGFLFPSLELMSYSSLLHLLNRVLYSVFMFQKGNEWNISCF